MHQHLNVEAGRSKSEARLFHVSKERKGSGEKIMYYDVFCVIDHINILLILHHVDKGVIQNYPNLQMPGGHKLFSMDFFFRVSCRE